MLAIKILFAIMLMGLTLMDVLITLWMITSALGITECDNPTPFPIKRTLKTLVLITACILACQILL